MRIVASSQINIIINYFKQNAIVCLPTDTIRAFSCSALNQRCVKKIFTMKRRDIDKTLPIFIQDINMLYRYAYLTKKEETLINDVWPGAVTFIVRAKKDKLPPSLVREGKIAVRAPSNKLIRKICSTLGSPIIATSANFTGQETIISIQDLSVRMIDVIDLFVKSTHNIIGCNTQSSTIIELINNRINILRQGAKVF